MMTFIRFCRPCSRVTLFLILLALMVALMQQLTGFPLRWSWELAPDAAERREGRGLEFRLPRMLSHDPEAPRWFAGVVCENDVPLARRIASRREVFERGEGRYWIKGERAAFSASDATTPHTNGRRYELRASVAVKGKHVIGLFLLGVAVLLISARLHGAHPSWRDAVGREWNRLCGATGLRALVAWRQGLSSTCLAYLTWTAMGCLVIWRLYAMAGEEIAASQWDPEMYALVALDPGTFGSHPPGVSWLMRAWAELGIPTRLGFELLYLAAAAILAAALAQISGNRVVGFLILLTFVQFPASRFFKMTSVEPVVLCSLTMAGGFILSGVSSKRNGLCNPGLLGAAGAFALWEVCRVETPLVMATAVLAACVYAQGRSWRHGSKRWRSCILAGGVLLSVTAVSWCFICAWNWTQHGVWAKCTIDLPGARRLLSALYGIETPDASRFAPVTRRTLGTAATVSPTIERRLSALLNPQSPAIAFGEAVCGRKGEAGPWLNWLLMEVFSQPPQEDASGTVTVGRWPVAKMNAEMQQAATEIRSAIDQGRIPGRRGLYPLDPHYREWIPQLPGAIQTACLELSDIPRYSALSDAGNYSIAPANDSLSPLTQAATDAAALRRASLTGTKWIDLELDLRKGWENVVMASVDIDGSSLAAARCEIRVSGGGSQWGHTRLRYGSFPDGEENRLSLRLWSAAGVIATIPWRDVRTGRVLLPVRSDNGQTMEVFVKAVARMPRSFIRENRQALLEALPALYKRGLPVLIAAALITGFLAGSQARGAAHLRTLWLACIWLAGILGGRLCFYALLFAMMGWGMARYLGPLAPLLYASFVAIAFASGVTIRLALRERGAEEPSPG